jgi:putative pyruvate formate lyase activating enzyme
MLLPAFTRLQKNCNRDILTGMNSCHLCPVSCGADREKTSGYCGVKTTAIAKYYLHPYEEPCISYKNGSGTIFFTGCNLRCVFCQNYELSRAERGIEVTPARLADIFKELEDMGAENVSLVTPSHVVEPIVRALEIYKPKIPVVFNSHGYEKVETLRLIDDYIDIYLPDLKFYSSSLAKRYTGKADYFDYASEAVRFMAQKPLRMVDGKMFSGCIVRHLILPLCSRDSIKIVQWVKDNLPASTYFSLMRQYTPFGEIENFPELKRKITAREYKDVLNAVLDHGLENVFLQDPSSSDTAFIPKWDY